MDIRVLTLKANSSSPTPDNAVEFFQSMVDPTVAEFLARPSDRRRGCLACLCLASMADHYFHARPKPVDGQTNPNAFRASLGATNWAVGQIIGVANATKHVLRRPDRVGYKDVSVRDINRGNLRFGWPISGTQVMIDVSNKNLWLLSDLIEEARTFWQKRLNDGVP